MPESRICLTKRLMSEKRWAEASAYRDSKRTELRASGRTKREANELAWEEMATAFPPLDPTPGLDPCGMTATAVEDEPEPEPLGPAELACFPPPGHPVRTVADTDMMVWSNEYGIVLPDSARDYLTTLLGYYWGAGAEGVVPQPDIFSR